MSLALGLYRALSDRAERPLRRLLLRRLARGKEDPARIAERLGHPGAPRPAGPLVWLHGASVGESLALLPLIAALRARRPDLHVLVTTGTITSAQLMAARLPKGALHQFVPVDAGPAVRRFLDHWRPDLAIWSESEFWPRLMSDTARRGIPMALVNGRLSAGSAAAWGRWAPAMAAELLGAFRIAAAVDEASAGRLVALGAAGAVATGSLKGGAAPPDLPAERAALAAAAAGRPVWLAASTHPGEEALILSAHRILSAKLPGLLTLIAPRHPERGEEILAALQEAGLRASRRGAAHALPAPGEELHLLDTMGELGAWFRMCPVAFIGGSLVETGGHNPHEPAQCGAAILHGPHVFNFAPDYALLAEAGGAMQVGSAAALAEAAFRLLTDEPARLAMTDAARGALPDGAAAREMVLRMLAPLLPPPVPGATTPEEIPQ